MAKVTGSDVISGDVAVHRQDPSAVALADGLRKAGLEGEARFDQGSRALYATDYSIYRQVPIGVVIPKTAEDVINAVDVCRQHGVTPKTLSLLIKQRPLRGHSKNDRSKPVRRVEAQAPAFRTHPYFFQTALDNTEGDLLYVFT